MVVLSHPKFALLKPQGMALQYDQMVESQTLISASTLHSMVDPPSSDPFPTEIWGNILAFTARELPEYTDVNITPQQMIQPPETFISAQSALFNLCLVSSRLEGLARPLLFKTIVIWKADSLVLLWRTLRRHPNLASHISQLACWITLTREVVLHQITQAVKEKLKLGASPYDQRLYEGIYTIGDWKMSQVIIFDMLCGTPHLTTLSLQVPRTEEHIHYGYLVKMIKNNRHLDGSMTLNHNHSSGLACSPATLQLCLDPCLPAALLDRADEQTLMGFNYQDYWPLYRMSGLVRLYCWGDDGFYGASGSSLDIPGIVGAPEGYFEGIREIRLDLSSSGPQFLYSLCRCAPHLETLRVSHRRHSQNDHFYNPSNSYMYRNLSNGLLLRAATLRHLYLDFYDSWQFLYFNGPDQKLVCLPELYRLETLHIQLQTLFGRRSAIPLYSFKNILPSSLAELTLDDEWRDDVIENEERIKLYSGQMDPEQFKGGWVFSPGTEAGFWGAYRTDIVEMLKLLCEIASEQLPQLRRVHYVSNHWAQRWGRYHPPEKPFDEIQAMFSGKSIDFYAGETMLMHR